MELQLDGLVGPTHNYAGLSRGNLASMAHGGLRSNPRAAALQGLAKMKLVADLGVPQGVLPPHERPDVGALRRLGFTGDDPRVVEDAARRSPQLLAAVSSASAMWAANAATASPAVDTADTRVHLTVANLASQLHRSWEPPTTRRLLQAIFSDRARFAVHPPLPPARALADEGAANHMRLAPSPDAPGVEVFVYGTRALGADRLPGRFAPRQTREASEAVARRHGLDPARCLFLPQAPEAVDAGVFHNDVAAVAHGPLLFAHERAYRDPGAFDRLTAACRNGAGFEPVRVIVPETRLPLAGAVGCYLFNSQPVTAATGEVVLLAPTQCEGDPHARPILDELVDGDAPVNRVVFVDVRESMRNGGGPACLRLRVPLEPADLERVHPGVRLTDPLHGALVRWIETHYRDRLAPADLADPSLLDEVRTALDALTQLLGLGSVYPFQGAEQPCWVDDEQL